LSEEKDRIPFQLKDKMALLVFKRSHNGANGMSFRFQQLSH